VLVEIVSDGWAGRGRQKEELAVGRQWTVYHWL
jgi:hypothetical protein